MKLMLTPTSGVPSEVTTCPRMTQAWLQGSEKDQHSYNNRILFDQNFTYRYIQEHQYKYKNNTPAVNLLISGGIGLHYIVVFLM